MKSLKEILQDPKRVIILVLCILTILGSIGYMFYELTIIKKEGITTVRTYYNPYTKEPVCNETYINGMLTTEMCEVNSLYKIQQNSNITLNFSKWMVYNGTT